MIDAFRRASARRITAVIPYFGYARQDRKVQPRVPITAKLVADLLGAAGADRVLTIDLHAGQIQGFFDIPVDHLFAAPLIIEHFQKLNLANLTVVSPDSGGVERARAFAKRMDAPLGIIDKRRERENVAQAMNIIGDVRDRIVLIVDDMIDTAGTLTEGARALMEKGATAIYAQCHSSSLFRIGYRSHRKLVDRAGRGDRYHPAETAHPGMSTHSSAFHRNPAGRRNPAHPQRKFCEFAVCLMKEMTWKS